MFPNIIILKGENMDNSTTHPRIVPIQQSYPLVSKKFILALALAFFGVCSLLSGIINLVLLLSAAFPYPASTASIQIPYELSFGVLILVSARGFARGKFLSVWLYAASMIIDSLYHAFMGYPLNYLFVGFGIFLIWQIHQFRNELGLK